MRRRRPTISPRQSDSLHLAFCQRPQTQSHTSKVILQKITAIIHVITFTGHLQNHTQTHARTRRHAGTHTHMHKQVWCYRWHATQSVCAVSDIREVWLPSNLISHHRRGYQAPHTDRPGPSDGWVHVCACLQRVCVLKRASV